MLYQFYMLMVISHSRHHIQLLFRSGYSQLSYLSIIISYSKMRELFDKVQLKSVFFIRLVCDWDLHVVYTVLIY